MAISPQRLTIYLYSAHRAVIFAIAQLSCYNKDWIGKIGSRTGNGAVSGRHKKPSAPLRLHSTGP